ncbi:MAG: hypothetical protein IK096_02695, partial [Lachnospiraceae bacterium]|nr:hypothetical protein [Lachnospiraceae bacterium]
MGKKKENAGGIMAAKKERKFRRLKRSHFGAVLITVLIIFAAVGVCATLFAELFFRYVVDARVLNEYHAVAFMAELYERSSGESAWKMLDREGRAYRITDADGNLIHEQGEISVGDIAGEYLSTSSDERIMIYTDSTLALVFPRDGHIVIRLRDTIRWINETGGMFRLEQRGEKLELPYWICIEMKDGQEKLYGRGAFYLEMGDVSLLIAIACAFVVMIWIALVVLIVSFISGIVRQNR